MAVISVIVPVYNSEKYLHRCIDSILSQTFTDFELLLINDGSKDQSSMICNEYARKDSRIRVFHKENGGVSSARNVGLDNAKGEWVVFVDSDDWVDEHYLEILYQDGKYDFVTCYWRLVNDKSYTCLVPADNLYTEISGIRDYLDKNIGKLSFPVCRLYRKSIIEKYRLYFNPKIHCCEDALFNISYIQYVNSIKQVGEIEYNYEKHEGSLSRVFIPWENMDYTINMLCEQIRNIEKQLSWSGHSLLQYYVWSVLLKKYLTYMQFNEPLYKLQNILREIYENEYVRIIIQTPSYTKSISRKIFDYFMINEKFFFAASFLKLECCLLKLGIISRK